LMVGNAIFVSWSSVLTNKTFPVFSYILSFVQETLWVHLTENLIA